MTYAKPAFRHPDARTNDVGCTRRDYEGGLSTLCAGCGHDSISAAIIDACFELCAHDTHGALVEMSGPLWSACAARLRDARGSMPPRPDIFEREAEGIHRRYYSMVHALLMRHDLDGSGLGHAPGTACPDGPTSITEGGSHLAATR